MRIRWRLAAYGIAVATAGMTLFGTLLSSLVASGVQTDQDALLTDLAERTASAVESTDDPSSLAERPLLVVDPATSTDPFVVVLDAAGGVVYVSGLVGGQVPRIPAAVLVEATDTGASVATIRPAGEREFRASAVRWQRPEASGVAVALQPTSILITQLAGFRIFLVLSAIVTIIVVAVVSWLVIGRALRPLADLAATADEIGRTGDLSRRLPARLTRDEVGRLTASFNGMLERIAAAREALAQALGAQRRFVADASHELRTPLTTIRTSAEFLRDRPDAATADRDEAIGDIAAEAERMGRLVDGLLLLARADAGLPLERRPVDLAVLAADAARKHRLAERAIAASGDGPVVVLGDPDGLARLVGILVDNALRHGDGRVTVRAETIDGRARLSVEDEGPGFPAGSEEQVFERFHRADPSRAGDGTGLGLAIARSIVEIHGGTIAAANRPDGGGRVTAELPLA